MKINNFMIIIILYIVINLTAQEITKSIPGENGKRLSDYENNYRSREIENYNVGEFPEGDYPNEIIYSLDGSKIFVVNRFTENITVFDAATETVIDNISIGSNPVSMAVNDDYAVVPCALSSDVYVIDLSDNSIAAQIAVNGEPVSVVINQNKAYIGCDTDNYFNDECAIIDLATLELENTITNFPVKILSYTYTFNNGRNLYNYSKFTVTDDGAYVVAGDWNDGINFYNTETGEIDYSVATDVVKNVSKSGDGSMIIGFSNQDIYQISTTTYSLTATVNLGAEQMPFQHIGIANQDGSKAFIALQSNKSAFIDFSTSTINTISQTYTPKWITANEDRSIVYSGQYRFTVLDFEDETVLGQHMGLATNKGVISPDMNKAIAISFAQFEGIFFYNITNLSNITLYNYELTGQAPEGDAPGRIKITPDGEKAFIINELSHNMTIFDIPTETFESFIDFDGAPSNIEITADGNWAIVTVGYLESGLVIYDINNEEIVYEIALGSYITNLAVNSSGTKAYVRDYTGGIFVINLDGASSSLETQVSCGNGTYSSYGFGIYSGMALTPDDAFLFISYTGGDVVQIMDTTTNTIVGDFPAGASPYDIIFSDSGEYALVLDPGDDAYSVVEVDGANTSVINTGSAIGEVPIRGNYNEVNNTFEFITFGNNSAETGAKLIIVNPSSGEILETINYDAVGTGNGLQVLNDEDGASLVLTSYKIIHGEDSYDLNSKSKYMAYSPQYNVVLAISPVSDDLYFLDLSGSSIETYSIVQPDINLSNHPNPFNPTTTITFNLTTENTESTELTIYNLKGQKIKTFPVILSGVEGEIYSVIWNGTDDNNKPVSSGLYFYKLKSGRYISTKKMILMK
ncbi:MAG: T9SS type A sorting domain-containing protein [Candidatus Cloacimonetes bacterium]|nr:T9SS type A sorting domain-containing protein [Candidatus Cloacimonadota bacterium]